MRRTLSPRYLVALSVLTLVPACAVGSLESVDYEPALDGGFDTEGAASAGQAGTQAGKGGSSGSTGKGGSSGSTGKGGSSGTAGSSGSMSTGGSSGLGGGSGTAGSSGGSAGSAGGSAGASAGGSAGAGGTGAGAGSGTADCSLVSNPSQSCCVDDVTTLDCMFGDTPIDCSMFGQVCGWDSMLSYYTCVNAPGQSSPSSSEPRFCGS